MRRVTIPLLAAALVFLIPTAALAHPGHPGHGGFATGFNHPFTGLDHLLAMFAVGIWSMQLGRSARWRVPAAFFVLMGVGGALAMLHVRLPQVESGVLASVLIKGLAVFFALQLRSISAIALAGAFAVFHGYAHLAEMPTGAFAVSYSVGFIAGSVVILAAGAAAAYALSSIGRPQWPRACGGAIAAAGLLLLVLA